MNTLVSALTVRLSTVLSSWMRNRRGSVAGEFVIGAVLIVTTTVAGLDLYRVINAKSVAVHAATTMASYLSLETAPREGFIQDLARFSYRNEIALPSEAAFVVSAVSRSEATEAEPDPPAVVRWNLTTVIGEDPDSPPTELGESCSRLASGTGASASGTGASGSGAGASALLKDLGMEPGEMVVVAEVCVKLLPGAFVGGGLLSGNLFPTRFYQHQILPVRGEALPAEPS